MCHALWPCCTPLLTQATGKADDDPRELARKLQEEMKQVTGFLE